MAVETVSATLRKILALPVAAKSASDAPVQAGGSTPTMLGDVMTLSTTAQTLSKGASQPVNIPQPAAQPQPSYQPTYQLPPAYQAPPAYQTAPVRLPEYPSQPDYYQQPQPGYYPQPQPDYYPQPNQGWNPWPDFGDWWGQRSHPGIVRDVRGERTRDFRPGY